MSRVSSKFINEVIIVNAYEDTVNEAIKEFMERGFHVKQIENIMTHSSPSKVCILFEKSTSNM